MQTNSDQRFACRHGQLYEEVDSVIARPTSLLRRNVTGFNWLLKCGLGKIALSSARTGPNCPVLAHWNLELEALESSPVLGVSCKIFNPSNLKIDHDLACCPSIKDVFQIYAC